MIRVITIYLLYVFCFVRADVGDLCYRNGYPGTCQLLTYCQPAIEALKKNIFPEICSFVGTNSAVCCAGYSSGTTTTPRPVVTTPKIKSNPRIVADAPIYESLDGTSGSDDNECEPVPSVLTSPKNGQKAFDMCLEYQQNLVYPCKNAEALIGSKVRSNHCHHKADELIINGENALPNEFSHMVLLGYGGKPEKVQWLCGGSLISDRFVLTAGHCISTRDRGQVSFAAMGTLKRSDYVDPANLRAISEIIPHPEYKPPSQYHDIALLKLQSEVTLSEYLVPACLHVPSDVDPAERALATGWGHTRNKQAESAANHLQKVILNKYSVEDCAPIFDDIRNLAYGYDNKTQICYGDWSKDTCQGDSGGPLQIKSKKIDCMYTIIGITSFGVQCGIGFPGVYTRVSNYVRWIERQVWP